MKLRRYCVTVMDNWTPRREFWTLGAALQFAVVHMPNSHLHVWNRGAGTWNEMQVVWLQNNYD